MALYAFDGTWNEDEMDEGKDSNVVRFRDAYQGRVYYIEGIGTRLGFIGKLLGGITGAGGKPRIHEAMEALTANLAAGERTIDVVGFSRGSALAMHFTNEINERHPEARIRFLGLWDLVASFGVPGNLINIGWQLTLPDNVDRCCHAMALDERRRNFPLTRITAADGSLPGADRLKEVWFRGVHSDVGGGKSVGLSHITLCWMMGEAQRRGVAFDPQRVAFYATQCDATAPISHNFDPVHDPARPIRPTDLVHHTVSVRANRDGLLHNNPSPAHPVDSA